MYDPLGLYEPKQKYDPLGLYAPKEEGTLERIFGGAAKAASAESALAVSASPVLTARSAGAIAGGAVAYPLSGAVGGVTALVTGGDSEITGRAMQAVQETYTPTLNPQEEALIKTIMYPLEKLKEGGDVSQEWTTNKLIEHGVDPAIAKAIGAGVGTTVEFGGMILAPKALGKVKKGIAKTVSDYKSLKGMEGKMGEVSMPERRYDPLGILKEEVKPEPIATNIATLQSDIATKQQAPVFRAVSQREFDAIKKTGVIKSESSLALPVEKQLGLTAYADDINQTKMYTAQGGDYYILEVTPTQEMRYDYTRLPDILAKRNEVQSELAQLEKTLAEKGAAWENADAFRDWIEKNKEEVSALNKQLTEAGIEESQLSGVKGANLPYRMTPRAVPASNIKRVMKVESDGTLKEVLRGKEEAQGVQEGGRK